MQTILNYLPQILILFDDGEGSAEGSGETAPVAGEQTGDIQSDAGSIEVPEVSPEERAKTWNDMIRGEYKDMYDADMQRIVKSRLKEMGDLKAQNSAQQDVIDRLAAKYGTNDLAEIGNAIDNDTSLWERAADEAGMTTEQYMKFQALQRQNAQLIRADQERYRAAQQQAQAQQWMKEADGVRAQFPEFNLQAELQNPGFANLLRSGVPMDHAYKVIHFNEIEQNTAKAAAAQTEKAVTDNIRARGSRPVENGSQQGHGAFQVTQDYEHMSLAQIKDIANQIKSGKRLETI